MFFVKPFDTIWISKNEAGFFQGKSVLFLIKLILFVVPLNATA